MALLTRVYLNAIFGGMGGLIAWVLLGVLGFRDASGGWERLWNGVIVGGSIGYLVVSVDAIRDRALIRFSSHASYGLILGALGGGLGMLLGEWVYNLVITRIGSERNLTYVLGTTWARGAGWMLMGLAVGMSEGVIARSMGKFSYGALGGLLGGFIGGAIFNLLYLPSRGEAGASAIASALGLVILGACIGSLSALVKAVFQPASVKVLRGWQEGREYSLDKNDNWLGRDEHVDIALFRDMQIEKKHAIIQREENRYILVNNGAPAEYTKVNGAPVPNTRDLQDGDRIELGRVVLKFQLRQAQSRAQRKRMPVRPQQS